MKKLLGFAAIVLTLGAAAVLVRRYRDAIIEFIVKEDDDA